MSITTARKAEVIKTYGAKSGDTGSPEVQVALLSERINNLTDHHNYSGYSGVITSPFYRQPTNVNNPRRVDVGMNLTF